MPTGAVFFLSLTFPTKDQQPEPHRDLAWLSQLKQWMITNKMTMGMIKMMMMMMKRKRRMTATR